MTDATIAADPGTVTVWSDIGCPWASLALHTLRATARARGQELLIDHRAFPLELFNSQPTPKFIVEPEVIVIGAHRPELGWRVWSGAESDYPSTTLPALEAVQAAKDPAVGGLRGSDQLDAALRHAFYAQSRCISVPSVILGLAEECPAVDAPALAGAMERGAGRAEVYAHWRIAEGPQIQGSPHLFTAGGFAAHNPGAHFAWTGDPQQGGLPRLDGYDASWAEKLLDGLREEKGR
ncbi:DsbA family protein [Streptomyces sp. JJ36]|uniref:DsbA family oxidoreductase n=1 Tax=Streptomyces sp. JJ36 TaxID=2736645 RepID=UPI001F41E368|nr:dithiol-disulfide isomerase [Streptomyces sp. JJ36]MCF6524119.1 dithiol-disulfide isomerase [Streptomyces sp. JJ36]